jgi:DNA (cytosine-5)-methyltransferase 1
MKFISLFSGIGGFDLGFERAGMECSAQVEWDKWAAAVLKHRWPDVSHFSDVREVHSNEAGRPDHRLDRVDLICGGFPCQDLSVAGKRAGLAGERSGLWHEFRRLVGEIHPRWVVVENVPGLLSSNGGADMAVVLRGLADLGYGWAYRVLDAQYFGVAQRRRRVFIVGHSGGGAGAFQVLSDAACGDGNPAPSRDEGRRIAATLTSGSSRPGVNAPGRRREDDTNLVAYKREGGFGIEEYDEGRLAGTLESNQGVYHLVTEAYDISARDGVKVSDTSSSLMASDGERGGQPGSRNQADTLVATWVVGLKGTSVDVHDAPARETPYPTLTSVNSGNYMHGVRDGLTLRRLTPTEEERLQAFPDGWTAVGINGRGTSGLQADAHRQKQLGNAVCSSVAYWIGRRIVEVDAGRDPNAADVDLRAYIESLNTKEKAA